MSKEMSTPSNKRTRNWNIIVYPESAPENWREIIDETHIEWIESPLHDKDIDEGTEVKKAHWHVSLLFPTDKSYQQVREITEKVNAPIPEKCGSVKGSIRYMVHRDHPDKFQYNWGDIKCHGGAELSVLCAPTATERIQVQKDIIDYIDTHNITEFADIVSYARSSSNDDWFNLLMNYSTISISTHITSRRHKADRAEREAGVGEKVLLVNPETGEAKEDVTGGEK